MLIKLVAYLVTLGVVINCEKFKFDNYALYKVKPDSVSELKVLKNLLDTDELDFWSDPVLVNDEISVVTSPNYRKQFDEILRANDIEANIILEDIQR